MNLYYHHSERRITNENGVEFTWEQAKELMAVGEVVDHDLAFRRLAYHDGDMEAVERDYEELEGVL